jgi:hypothetical protein
MAQELDHRGLLTAVGLPFSVTYRDLSVDLGFSD